MVFVDKLRLVNFHDPSVWVGEERRKPTFVGIYSQKGNQILLIYYFMQQNTIFNILQVRKIVPICNYRAKKLLPLWHIYKNVNNT